jgi:hypothetical protein
MSIAHAQLDNYVRIHVDNRKVRTHLGQISEFFFYFLITKKEEEEFGLNKEKRKKKISL